MEIAVNDANFKQEVLDSVLPVLVDFWAAWCGPCQMVAPIIEEIAKEYKGRLKVCKIDVDQAPKTASSYGIMSIPTLAIFKKGQIADTVVGALPKAELEKTIKKHVQ